jgi:hypothetical protein
MTVPPGYRAFSLNAKVENCTGNYAFLFSPLLPQNAETLIINLAKTTSCILIKI